MIALHTNRRFSEASLDLIIGLENLIKIEKYFYFDLIPNDADDNKFVDCAIAAGADFIISEDRAFRILKKIPFPKMSCLTVAEFAKLWTI